MQIAIAQLRSDKFGFIDNINKHLTLIELALQQGAELIVFPELSLTAYEPVLACEHARELNSIDLQRLQQASSEHGICICAGIPLQRPNGIAIATLIIRPDQAIDAYCKQILHQDEVPFYIPGNKPGILSFASAGLKVGLAICYEALQPEHFQQARAHSVDIYIASVAKPQKGVAKAYDYFPNLAAEHNCPILMANAIGPADNFIAAGQSSIWNSSGERIAQFNDQQEGVLIYNSNNQQARSLIISA